MKPNVRFCETCKDWEESDDDGKCHECEGMPDKTLRLVPAIETYCQVCKRATYHRINSTHLLTCTTCYLPVYYRLERTPP